MNAMLRPGATIPVNQTRPPLNLTVVFNGFKPLFQALSPNDINQLSFEIIQVLQGEGGTVNSPAGPHRVADVDHRGPRRRDRLADHEPEHGPRHGQRP